MLKDVINLIIQKVAMFQIIMSTMFQHFKHLAQLQLNETSQGEVMCSDVGSISENFLQNQQTESTYWIYKMDLKSTKIESGMHKLLEPHTPQNLLDTTVPHFLANWKKSTRVMCIWDIVGGATHHCHLFQPIEFRIWLQSFKFIRIRPVVAEILYFSYFEVFINVLPLEVFFIGGLLHWRTSSI